MPNQHQNSSSLNILREMPFFSLTDMQLTWENETIKRSIIDKMDNNGFIGFFKNTYDFNDSKSFLDKHKYYDIDELN